MNLKEEIYNHFKDDKLYAYLLRQGFNEKQLVPGFIDNINPEKMYSTIEVAELLCVSDNDLRYSMKRMRGMGYLKIVKAGRHYRFNYFQIYQMYLVVSILNLPYHTTSDISEILGYKDSTSLNSNEGNQISTNEVDDTKVSIATKINSSCTLKEGQILLLQYEIARIEQKLNATWRDFLQLDSKFNLALIENKYAADLKAALSNVKTGWFSKSNNDLEALAASEKLIDLIEVKEQLTEIQGSINEYEKELAIKMHELKQLIDEKMRVFRNF